MTTTYRALDNFINYLSLEEGKGFYLCLVKEETSLHVFYASLDYDDRQYVS